MANDLDDIQREEFDDDPPTCQNDVVSGGDVESFDSYERLLLAAAFRDPTLIHMAAGEFVFDDPVHEAVLLAMLCCVHTGDPVTEGTVVRALRDAGRLDQVGGWVGLRELLLGVPDDDVERVLLDLRIARDALPPVAAECVVVEAIDLLEAEDVAEDVEGKRRG